MIIKILVLTVAFILLWRFFTNWGNKRINDFAEEADYYFQKEDYITCINILTKGIKIYPGAWQLYNNRGNAYYQLENYELALNDFEKSIKWCNNPNKNPKAFGNRDKTIAAITMRDLITKTK